MSYIKKHIIIFKLNLNIENENIDGLNVMWF